MKWQAPGWQVEAISLRLTAGGEPGQRFQVTHDGPQFRVRRPGLVDYVRTVAQLQALMGDDYAELTEVTQ